MVLDITSVDEIEREIELELEKSETHHLFEMDLIELGDLFLKIFEDECNEMLHGIECGRIPEDLSQIKVDFSQTLYSIRNMIIYRYFNESLPFYIKQLMRSDKYPFSEHIKELENKLHNNGTD